MRTRSRAALLAAALGLAGLGTTACSQIETLKAQMAFKDANAAYQQGDYRKAVEEYKTALELRPVSKGDDLAAAYFYLGNSYDNLYRPARKGEAQNDEYLRLAVENYKKATETIENPKLRTLSYQYLLASYGSDKLDDPSQAEPIVREMIEMDPSDASNYFSLARIYEDAGNFEEAEKALLQAREAAPKNSDVYMQMAGFYNRQGEFEKTIDALQQRAAQDPENPEAHYTIATYFWDKTFRDKRLKDDEKRGFIERGLKSADRALEIKDDYTEALVYKGLLLRLQANLERDRAKQQALLKEADELRDRATALRKKQNEGAGAGATE
jgi:tetratricopeptide (TPR) repeat protein